MPGNHPPGASGRLGGGVRVLALLLLAVVAGACAKVQARTPLPPPPPPLETPAPEPRLIIPVSIEPEEVPPPPAATTTAPAPRRDASTTAKPPPAASTPPTPPASPPADPQPVLQTTPNMGQLETEARNQLASANHNLNRVQVWTLDSQGITNWKHVRHLIAAAQRALDLKNFDFAKQVAGKAARLAAQLVKTRPGD